MSKLYRSGLTLAVVALSLACSERPEPAVADAGGVVRDSAGVRIVSHGLATSDATWALADSAVWRLDGVPDRESPELSGVERAAFLGDGRLVVGHRSVREMLIVDAMGVVVRAIGRQGSGPGEFQLLMGPFVSRDGLLSAYDIRARRLSTFDSTGAFLGARSSSQALTADSTFTPTSIVGMGAHGDGLFVLSYASPVVDGVMTIEGQLAWLDSTAVWQRVGPLHRLPATGMGRPAANGSFALTRSALAPTLLATTCGDHIVYADTHQFEIQRTAAKGSATQSIRTDWPAREPTDADYAIAMALPYQADTTRSPELQAVVDNMRAQFPDARVPLLSALHCDAAANVWASLAVDPSTLTRRVLSFAPDGSFRGEFTLLANVRLLAIHNDQVAVAAATPDGSESVAVYSLHNVAP